VKIQDHVAVHMDDVSMSQIHVDNDLLPTAIFGVHLKRLNQPAGWLIGEISLEEMWRMVDRIRIGEHGYAMVVAPDGQLVAHGDPDKKALIAQMKNAGAHPLVAAAWASSGGAPVSREYVDEDGRQDLGVAAKIPSLGWTVIVEQPTREAYATATQLQRLLAAVIAGALIVMVGFGYVFGRSFINPILTLKRATHELADGNMSARVDIQSDDEIGDLGRSFNTMADRLVELQEDVKKQERQAMFGRVAAGLVHDLSHPIQNIGNSTRLLMRDDLEPEGRELFRRTIDRELATLKRFMEDLRHVVKPKPIERFPIDVNSSVAEVVESLRPEGDQAGIKVDAVYAQDLVIVDGDRFALARVFRNLGLNAVQATERGGSVTLAVARAENMVEVLVSDTGSGIPADRLPAIFEEYMTTKRRGLGLGLAITKRIVEQLEGTITVESEVGRGTSFTLRFPVSTRAAQVAAV
jgi:signal transduction histidine kinase